MKAGIVTIAKCNHPHWSGQTITTSRPLISVNNMLSFLVVLHTLAIQQQVPLSFVPLDSHDPEG